jgi:peptidyl-prolyl cis-trans isomerase C
MKKAVLICILAVAVMACSKKEADVKGAYLARIDNTNITQADFDSEFQALPDYARQMFADAAGKEKFLNEIINKELIYKEALKKGVDKSPEFNKKVEDFRKLTLVSQVFEKEILAKAGVPDQEIKDYYEKNKNDFVVAKELRASHILVKTEGEAGKVLERLKKGEKFDAIARAVSIDTGSAKNGGDLGFFKKGQMVPEFERGAASLNVGEITSSPVKTQFGYHIIKVTDKKAGEPIPYEKIHDLISQKLSGEKQRAVFDAYMAELKKSHKVEINREGLLKAGPAPAQPAVQEAPAMPEEKKEEPKK